MSLPETYLPFRGSWIWGRNRRWVRGLIPCRSVRNWTEVERRETEVENNLGVLPGSTRALSSLQAQVQSRHLRALALVDLCLILEDHHL